MSYFKNLSEEKKRLNLKSEKLELSLIDDIEKDFKQLNDIMSEAEKLTKQRSKLKGKGNTLSKNIIKQGEKGIKQLEDLGMNAEAGFLKSMVAYANNSLKSIKANFTF
jgi:uncharacterized membrane-anchored protein